MMKKAVILLSGGLDSTTCLAIGQSQGFDCYTLSFDYSQRHRAELDASKQIAQAYGVRQHRVVTLDINQFGGSALTDNTIDVPNYQDKDEIPVTYVPARNTIFLSIALGYAEVINAFDIFIGVSSVDYSGYPDCRPEFISAYQDMANLATKNGIQGKHVTIHAPLIHMSKEQTIKTGQQLGVDYSKTVSCYRLSAQGLACGSCDSCILRKRAFEQAKATDVTLYA
jgi:7-cyano-7-deazaguanine synthase